MCKKKAFVAADKDRWKGRTKLLDGYNHNSIKTSEWDAAAVTGLVFSPKRCSLEE